MEIRNSLSTPSLPRRGKARLFTAKPKSVLPRSKLLEVGGSAVAGLALPMILSRRAQAAAEGPTGRRPKSVILILLTGGAAHQDTFDLKPEAPDGVRSDFT